MIFPFDLSCRKNYPGFTLMLQGFRFIPRYLHWTGASVIQMVNFSYLSSLTEHEPCGIGGRI